MGFFRLTITFLMLPWATICISFENGEKVNKVNYPISASWFRDRFTVEEWNNTLDKFGAIGGNKVFLRAPEFTIRTSDEILKDPQFQWCYGENNPSTNCVDETMQLASGLGLNITAWATYQYEEDFSDQIITCKSMDTKITSSRIYYRLMLPVEDIKVKTCPYPRGTNVIVLLTSFAGIDPHHLLLQSAADHNMTVFFSVPRAPKLFRPNSYISAQYIVAYYNFVERILLDHKARYSVSEKDNLKFEIAKRETKMKLEDERSHGINFMHENIGQNNDASLSSKSLLKSLASKPLYDTIAGYYSPDMAGLALLTLPGPGPDMQLPFGVVPHLDLYSNLGRIVHTHGKKFVVSPGIDLLKSSTHSMSIADHVRGLNALANTESIDIIAVVEGRGSGFAPYYYDLQVNETIATVDPGLDRILKIFRSDIAENATFADLFTGSVKELFQGLNIARQNILKTTNSVPFDLWFVVEAFEHLRDDPCLPIDTAESGFDVMWDRTTKTRVDWALSFGSVYVQQVAAFAWDPGFTCHTKTQPGYLAAEIYNDIDRPIIADCRWHSPSNMSIVVIGYNLAGLTQQFEVHYRGQENKPRNQSLFGYYFELDYGIENKLVPSLMYIQLFDLMDIAHIPKHGSISVRAEGGDHICMFTY